MSSVKAYLELARWKNALMAAFGVAVGASPRLFMIEPVAMVAAICSAIALTVTANATNDVADADLDRVAHPARPIPSGRISKDAARRTALLAAALGIAFSTVAAPALGAISLGVVAIMFLYSPWLKRNGLVGNAIVAVLASLPFLYGAWIIGEPRFGLLLVVLAVPLHFARELAKDIDDATADAGARRTLPIVLGVPATRRAVAGLIGIYAIVPFVFLELISCCDIFGRAGLGILIAELSIILMLSIACRRVWTGRPGAPDALKGAMVGFMIAAFLLLSYGSEIVR